MIPTPLPSPLPVLPEIGSNEDSGSPEARMAPPRFVFAPSQPAQCDEQLLSHWWEHMGLEDLPTLAKVFMTQSIELSQGRLEMENAMAVFAARRPESPEKELEQAMHLVISQVAQFQHTRITAIAKFAGAYIRLLVANERLQNADHAIDLHQSIENRRFQQSGDRAHNGRPASSPIAELHAFRETLSGERNAVLLSLSEKLCEPVSITRARVLGHCLPPAMAALPLVGTPEDLTLRRPDLLALEHAMMREESIGPASSAALRHAELGYERACLMATTAVEQALNRLISATSSLIPARACAANADANARLVQTALNRREVELEVISQAHLSRFNFNDREISIRGDTYLALIQLFQALGAGWESEAFMHDEKSMEGNA